MRRRPTINIFFTADRHFGHARIIELAKRPFSSVAEMDEIMIERHNKVVRPGDIVHDLGDFAFADHEPYLRRLNGQMHLTLGNHDNPKRVKAARHLWASIESLRNITLPDGTHLTLCHYGLRVWSKSHHGALHLYGHSHGRLPGDSQCCDVGVDCWDFTPVSTEEIRARLATLARRREPDHQA
ncbi:metallophosphoesterase [Bradyrhizobium sp. HKCCYLS3077]|uniref:metallophosphoesterase n=1 Tax=Bradyrhizobium sp. HKCCYLS3077 TaxID=3420761 RepID=UPI003EB6D2E2